MAVYHGVQVSDPGVYGVLNDGHGGYLWGRNYSAELGGLPYSRNYNAPDTNYNIVFMYPVEYNAASSVSYRPKKSQDFFQKATWEKHIILTDRMGSTKMVISPDETEKFDYLPFGKQIPVGDADQRTAYLGKELDSESELGDHGVRKVDYELGKFTTALVVLNT